MFIDAGSVVIVKESGGKKYAGNYGTVNKIRIAAHSSHVCVFVDVFNRETGATDCMMFEPEDLEKRRYAQTTAKRLARDPVTNAFIFQDLAT